MTDRGATPLYLTSNAQVVGSSPTRSSIVSWNVAIRLGEPLIKSLTQKGVQDDSSHQKKPLAFQRTSRNAPVAMGAE